MLIVVRFGLLLYCIWVQKIAMKNLRPGNNNKSYAATKTLVQLHDGFWPDAKTLQGLRALKEKEKVVCIKTTKLMKTNQELIVVNYTQLVH